MKYTYIPKGVCSREISFELDENNIVKNVSFKGGCFGNTQGICKLVENMKAEDVIAKLKNIKCRNNTSCPDQLAKALEEKINNK